jgi:hypothetical protein
MPRSPYTGISISLRQSAGRLLTPSRPYKATKPPLDKAASSLHSIGSASGKLGGAEIERTSSNVIIPQGREIALLPQRPIL